MMGITSDQRMGEGQNLAALPLYLEQEWYSPYGRNGFHEVGMRKGLSRQNPTADSDQQGKVSGTIAAFTCYAKDDPFHL